MTGLILTLLGAIVSSPGGCYRLEVEYAPGTELAAQELILHDASGAVVYRVPHPPGAVFFVNDSGCVFALSERILCVLEPDGKARPLARLEYANGFAFSPDQRLFYASDRTGIRAFDLRGDLVCGYRPGRLFTPADPGECFAVVSVDTLCVYREGAVILERVLPSPFARRVEIGSGSVMVTMRERPALRFELPAAHREGP